MDSSVGERPAAPPTPSNLLARSRQAGDRVLDRLCEGRWWELKVTVFAALTSVLLAFPSFATFKDNERDWAYVIHKGHSLMYQEDPHPFYRTANLTYRLTVPLIGGRLGFDSKWEYYGIQVLFGLVLLWAAVKLFDALLDDRGIAALLTFAVALCYVGETAFVENRAVFDGVAMALLTLAALAKRPVLVFLAALAAGFTDERALIALGLVWIFQVVRADVDDDGGAVQRRPLRLARLFDARAVATVAAVAAYVVLRVALARRYDLLQPHDALAEDRQFNIIPMGVWTGLEGLWVVVAAGLVALWQVGRRLPVVAAVVVTGIAAVGAVLVIDVTRSMIYVFPVVFLAVLGLARLDRTWVKRLAWWVFSVSLIWPAYYAGGQKTVLWQYPFPFTYFT